MVAEVVTNSRTRVVVKGQAHWHSDGQEDRVKIEEGVVFSWNVLNPAEAVMTLGDIVWKFLIDLLHPSFSGHTGDIAVIRLPGDTDVQIILDTPHGSGVLFVEGAVITEFLEKAYSKPALRRLNGEGALPQTLSTTSDMFDRMLWGIVDRQRLKMKAEGTL